MAPVSRYDHDALEQQLKETIQSLYQILVQVSAYDTNNNNNNNTSTTSTPTHPSSITSPNSNPNPNPNSSSSSRDVLANEIRALERSLQAVRRTAATPSPEASLPRIPPELIQYVEGGRNPDIYTREFVELVRRSNQMMRGKQHAFASFRDVLAAEMEKAMPELRDDAARVVRATSGEGDREGGPGRGS